MVWLRQLVTGLSLQRLRLNPRLFHLGFVVGEEILEQVFLQALWFSPASVIPPTLRTRVSFIYHLGYMILGTNRAIKLNAALSCYRGRFSEFQRMTTALLELGITLFVLKNIVIEVQSDYK